jgi:alpha-ketoglutarate-dependent taurine dioxygenase
MNVSTSNPLPISSDPPRRGPFDLEDVDAYRRWRDRKLSGYPTATGDLVVEICDPRALSEQERERLVAVCRKTNMVVYAPRMAGAADKALPRRLGEQLGLVRLDHNMLADEDGITALEQVPGKASRGYIPYSNRRLLWHTDGYYNPPERRIRGMLLHCVEPAAEGGENQLMDHEIVYILLRDRDPAHIRALTAPDAMTIPANADDGAGGRAACTGPVFLVDEDGSLAMRYTARTRSIVWKDDDATRGAVAALEHVLAEPSPFRFTLRLQAGQGLVCNNVLHNRTGFEDAPGRPPRLVYRGRYLDRVAGTGVSHAHLHGRVAPC